MGPLLIYHLGGGSGGVHHFVDHLGEAFTSWWRDMRTWDEIPPSAVEKIVSEIREWLGERGEGEAWRDEHLVMLLKQIDQSPLMHPDRPGEHP